MWIWSILSPKPLVCTHWVLIHSFFEPTTFDCLLTSGLQFQKWYHGPKKGEWDEWASQEASSLSTTPPWVLLLLQLHCAVGFTEMQTVSGPACLRVSSIDHPCPHVLRSYFSKRGSALGLLSPLCGSTSGGQKSCQASSEELCVLILTPFLAALG